MASSQMKTVSVALVVCLNIGVDPPDVIKTTPCARLECWVDPHALPPPKAVDTIGKTLQMQYERWQPRVRVNTIWWHKNQKFRFYFSATNFSRNDSLKKDEIDLLIEILVIVVD